MYSHKIIDKIRNVREKVSVVSIDKKNEMISIKIVQTYEKKTCKYTTIFYRSEYWVVKYKHKQKMRVTEI